MLRCTNVLMSADSWMRMRTCLLPPIPEGVGGIECLSCNCTSYPPQGGMFIMQDKQGIGNIIYKAVKPYVTQKLLKSFCYILNLFKRDSM